MDLKLRCLTRLRTRIEKQSWKLYKNDFKMNAKISEKHENFGET